MKIFPMFGEAPMKRRKRMRRSRWTRDRALTLLELGLLLGSLALLAMGSRYRVYPLSLSLGAAAVAMVHVMIVRRTRAQSPAERLLEDAPMLDFSHAVRTARSVEALYQSLIGMVNTTFPSKAVSLFVRDDETGNYSCRMSTALPHTNGNGVTPTLTSDAFVVRRLRGLDSPMQLDDGELKSWQYALSDAPPEVFNKRMRERDTLEKTNSSLLVQLKTKSDLVGVLSLGESTIGRFSRKDQEVLKGVAGQLALVIENAKLAERMVEHQRLQAELALAAEVQRSLLPVGAPVLEGFQLCGVCKPAQQVGGDYYDFVTLDQQRTGIAIADVAGKGISAALMMSVVQASLRGQLMGAGKNEIAELVKMLNRLICGSVSSARYVTFFYAQLDGADGAMRYINAGHNAPLVYSREQNDFRALHDGGPVLGLFQDVSFNEGLAKLDSGDVLVAYTDGVTEAENGSEEEFGEERLRAAIEAASSGSAKKILDHISGEVAEWSKGVRQHDDITLVVLKRN